MKLLAKYYSIQDCVIGEGTVIRDFVNLYGCTIGKDCKIAAFCEIQKGVRMGDRCKVEAFAFIPTGVTIEDEVFIGPHAVFTNDSSAQSGRRMGDSSHPREEGRFDRSRGGCDMRRDDRGGINGRSWVCRY